MMNLTPILGLNMSEGESQAAVDNVRAPQERISALQNNLNFVYDNASDHRNNQDNRNDLMATPTKNMMNPSITNLVQFLDSQQQHQVTQKLS